MLESDYLHLRKLLDDYLRMYASRDDRLTSFFSEDFSGFTGGGDFLVKTKEEWVAITRQDFAQVKDAIRIELKDTSIQSLSETIALATSFFSIHLPFKDHVLARETARLVLLFRNESEGWKICHSSISIPYYLVREGEVYPLKELADKNQMMEKLVAERTSQLSAANENLRKANEDLEKEISEHQQAKAALQRSEERYRSILTASPDDITIADHEGRILMVSPKAFTIFGYERDAKFEGLHVTDFIVPEDRPRALANVAKLLKGIIPGPSEYRGLHRSGCILDIEVNSEFIRDPKGSPTGMVVIVRDITKRKQAEAEKERLESQNRLLQKNESLGRMAGAIAHHFNNQLHAVMMGLELAMKDLPANEKAVANMALALQSAKEAAGVSRKMLTYLGQEIIERKPHDLSQLCTLSLPLLQAVMPSEMTLDPLFPIPGPVITANDIQIQHVLTNLVTNAWEASEARSARVRLKVSTVPSTAVASKHRYPIDWEMKDSSYACLEVSDSGYGIPDQEIEAIFDPFYSSKSTGRGMGLAIVLGIVRAHSGVITVDSIPGEGSTFRIYFPVPT